MTDFDAVFLSYDEPMADSLHARSQRVLGGTAKRVQCGGKLAFGCGLRQGEVFGFDEDELDFDRGVVHINQQIKLVRSTMVFAPPKGNRLRTVPCRTSSRRRSKPI